MKKILLVGALAAIAAGCVSVNKNTGDDANLNQWVMKDVIHHKVEVGQKQVTATDQLHSVLGFINWGGSEVLSDQTDAGFGAVGQAKSGAYAKACDAADCDQLAAARYKVTTKDYVVYKFITAEVKGFPVKVSSVDVIENKVITHSAGKLDVKANNGGGRLDLLSTIKGAGL